MALEQHPSLVTTPEALSAHISELRTRGIFAFDTEFVGEDRYKPEVCLIQTATDDAQYLIDPLAGVDCRPFWELVTDPSIKKVIHAGSEDLSLCGVQIGRAAANVFDLQIAAGFVGHGYPTSLARLVRVAAHARLHKSQTLTDWRRRPLTPDQIDYAAQDVAYLPAIHRVLIKELEERNRASWVTEECDALCKASFEQTSNPVRVRRLKGMGTLTARERAIADALLLTRDQLAKEMDRPARTILRDHLLVELARRGWTDPGRIASLRGLNLSAAATRRVAAAIESVKAQKIPDEPAAVDGDTPEEEVLLSLLSAVLRDYANRVDVAYSLLATKEQLRDIVRSRTRPNASSANAALMSGWRGQAIGELLSGILDGRRSVRVVRSGKTYHLSD